MWFSLTRLILALKNDRMTLFRKDAHVPFFLFALTELVIFPFSEKISLLFLLKRVLRLSRSSVDRISMVVDYLLFWCFFVDYIHKIGHIRIRNTQAISKKDLHDLELYQFLHSHFPRSAPQKYTAVKCPQTLDKYYDWAQLLYCDLIAINEWRESSLIFIFFSWACSH